MCPAVIVFPGQLSTSFPSTLEIGLDGVLLESQLVFRSDIARSVPDALVALSRFAFRTLIRVPVFHSSLLSRII